ncbi:MAG TPA: hypothetical protein VET66_04005 [Steroidobacteraceae bacterium]|nr:hypothetical protein [Steroidobacteraceae bacterium]
MSYIPVEPTLSIMAAMRIAYMAALVPLLASCASSGLYNMSDEWCAAHVSASASRCPLDRQRVAENEPERVASNAVGQHD